MFSPTRTNGTNPWSLAQTLRCKTTLKLTHSYKTETWRSYHSSWLYIICLHGNQVNTSCSSRRETTLLTELLLKTDKGWSLKEHRLLLSLSFSPELRICGCWGAKRCLPHSFSFSVISFFSSSPSPPILCRSVGGCSVCKEKTETGRLHSLPDEAELLLFAHVWSRLYIINFFLIQCTKSKHHTPGGAHWLWNRSANM